jgi:hypothetical protein
VASQEEGTRGKFLITDKRYYYTDSGIPMTPSMRNKK